MPEPAWPAALPSHIAANWTLDPDVVYLNHGAYGACPKAVLERQAELRRQLERQPVKFMQHTLPPLLDASLEQISRLVNAPPEHLAFVTNATAGVNAVLRSLTFSPGDELLTTQHCYNACRNVLDYVATRCGARVVTAEVPFPCDEETVIERVVACVTDRTRLALLDHVTSPTGMVFPVARLVRALESRGIETLIDGAHALGMVHLDLTEIGATYYTANCHKWLCAPKGCAILYVAPGKQRSVQPVVISHGYNAPPAGRSPFQRSFEWAGTHDPTAYLSVPAAQTFMNDLLPGGWGALQRHNHAQTVAARDFLAPRLGVSELLPEGMLGSLAALPLPPGPPLPPPGTFDPLYLRLGREHHIEVPVYTWASRRYLRISAQVYNQRADYERLAEALAALAVTPA
jgi:isopenicillin-N epimerase